MNVFQCAAKGIRESSARPKMVLLLWAFNVFAASLTYALFSGAFGGAVGTSALVKEMVKKADMNVIIEFLTSNGGGTVADLLTIVLALSVLYLFVSVFLHGGILQTLIRKEGGGRFLETFFAGGGKFYGRFLRLSIYSLVLWLTAGLLYTIVNYFLTFNYRDSADEQTMFVLTIIKILFALFLIFLIKMITDYARILIAARDSREVFRSLLEAFRFVLRKAGKTLSVYYLLGVVGWAAFLVYRILNSAFSQTSGVAIAVGFILAQIFIASRGWLRVAYQAAQGKVIGLI